MVRKTNKSKDETETENSEGWVPKKEETTTDESTLEAPTETKESEKQPFIPPQVNCSVCGGPGREVHQDIAGWSLWQCVRCMAVMVVKKPGSEFSGNFVEVPDQQV